MAKLKIEDVEMVLHPEGGYGQYLIRGKVNGKNIKMRSTNSEAYDWIKDDSNFEKHKEAVNYIYSKLKNQYENQLEWD